MHQTFFYKQQLTYSGLNELADDVSDNSKSHDHTEGAGGTGKKLTSSGLDNGASPEIRDYDSHPPFIVTDLLPATSGTLTSNISAGEGYAPDDGSKRLVRVVRESATSHTYNANKDTYVYLHPYQNIHGGDDTFFHFIETANGAGEPLLPDSSTKLAKVVTDGSQITSVTDLRETSPIFDNSVNSNKVTLDSGFSVLASSFFITAANGTYEDTGLSINLPAAGTYLLVADVRVSITFSAGGNGFITAKLYNSTDAADITNSHRLIMLEDAVNTNVQTTSSISIVVTVDGPKTIKLYVSRNGATTWTSSQIVNNANGTTTLSFVRVD
jgi:hypothetical protein